MAVCISYHISWPELTLKSHWLLILKCCTIVAIACINFNVCSLFCKYFCFFSTLFSLCLYLTQFSSLIHLFLSSHLLTLVSEFISLISRHLRSCVSALFAENFCLFGSFLLHVAYKSPQAFSIPQVSLRAVLEPYSSAQRPILASYQ